MKKIYLLVAFQFLLSYSIFSQGWTFQNPKPQGNDLKGVNFFDRNNGWVVGATGMILHTTNGGTSWDIQKSNTTSYLYSVKALSASIALVTGQNGIILRTTDGGTTWTSYTSSVNTTLTSQYFINAQIGFVTPAFQGALLKTTDGGITWTTITTGITDQVNDISFKDANVGFMVTGGLFSSAGLYRTDNGGNTWVSQSIPTSYSLNAVCVKDTVAWAVGYDGVILKTTNNTTKWISINAGNINTKSLYGLDFYNINVGIAVGEMGETKRTSDQGNTWTLLMSDFNQLKTVINVQMIDTLYGFLVGNKGKIMKTTDGGLTWKHSDNDVRPNFWSVWFTDANNGVAVGDSLTSAAGYTDAKVYVTNNGGNNWTERQSITNATLLGVHFPTSSTGYAVGFNGLNAIYTKTTNGGSSWTSGVIGNFKDMLWSVFFSDVNNGIAVGDSGMIMKTTDGGNSWLRRKQNITTSLFFVYSSYNIVNGTPAADTGYISFAVGSSGAFYKSKDLGDTWSSVTTPMSAVSIYGIHVVPRKVIWIVGSANNIYKSTVNGTFVKQTLPSSGTWIGIYASDENNACAIGSYGAIAATTDGGATWKQQFATTNNLNAVHFENNNVGWIVGEGGTILYTSNGGATDVGKETNSKDIPDGYALYQNYPNPFNPSTTIRYGLPSESKIEITIYNLLGQKIRELLNSTESAGNHEVIFNASNLASGIYFYRIAATSANGSKTFIDTKKLILMK